MRILVFVGLTILILQMCSCNSNENSIKTNFNPTLFYNATFRDTILGYELKNDQLQFQFSSVPADKHWWLSFRLKDTISDDYLYFKATEYQCDGKGIISITDKRLYSYDMANSRFEEFLLWSDDSWYLSNCQIIRFKFIDQVKNKLHYLPNAFHTDCIKFDYLKFKFSTQYDLADKQEVISQLKDFLECGKKN